MNILIPMAGLGSRFLTKGNTQPKPLIDINGKPMIVKALDSMKFNDCNYKFVVSSNNFSKDLKILLEKNYKAKIIEIDYLTEGPANSALLFEKQIDNDEELVIANCDQIMEWNCDMFLLNARQFDGMVVTYHETNERNSFAEVDENGFVTRIKEKEVISNISLNGIHYWKKGSYFVDSAKSMIENDDRAPNGEFYVGPSYNYMIANNLKVGIYHIPNQQHHSVGIPEHLEKYIEYENRKA